MTKATKKKWSIGDLYRGKKLSEEHRKKVIKTLSSYKRLSGKDNPSWKGGKSKKDGYIIMRCPKHPNCFKNGYYSLHRLVMEKHLGRYLDRTEQVHHINGIKTDNRLKNLVLISRDEHSRLHRLQEVKNGNFRKFRPNFKAPNKV